MRTIVILHGWGHDRSFWQQAASNLPIQVRTLDLPGFGSEPLVNPDWGVLECAAWVREKIESEGLQDVILLGHSFGGRVAAELASMRPQWLKGLMLYAAPCIYRPTTSIRAKARIAKIAKSLGFSREYQGNPELNDARKRGLGEIYRRVVNYDQTDALKRISVPTVLLWGERDTDVPLRVAQEMSELIRASTLEILPGLGHNAHIENPNLFYGVVKKHIQTF